MRNFCSLYLKIKGSVSKRFFPFAYQSNSFSELCYTCFFALTALPIFTRILSDGPCHFISKEYIFQWGWFCLGLWFAHLKCWRWVRGVNQGCNCFSLVILSPDSSLNLLHPLFSLDHLLNFGILLFKLSRFSLRLNISPVSCDLIWTTYTYTYTVKQII